MKASDAKPFIGKVVIYKKKGWWREEYGIVTEVFGRNIILETDALWAPDIVSMQLVDKHGENND